MKLGSIGAAIQGVIKEAEVAGDHLFGDKVCSYLSTIVVDVFIMCEIFNV